ncbi:hypothetical protein A1O1_03008 [Capronia coronata CBS 617.96]|uniref:Zn(2)-C6 fungal-type domain-containing protein n=1 Tax=Capronia coronata CBS 617.96 TaxID=1182541 RepID=W9YNU7_9EURO|nr:uncharacterized protein A1O1_03008 [Capronia coronata CBS 617.96]EXJ94612.1 hypothetical protein A1O1_03008 [Capronia coronata CBS 617.96]
MASISTRPKKTNIVRSRGGCHTCRRRRVKCDQARPGCGACTRLQLECEGYSTRLRFNQPPQSVPNVAQTVKFAEWGPIYVPRPPEDHVTPSTTASLSSGGPETMPLTSPPSSATPTPWTFCSDILDDYSFPGSMSSAQSDEGESQGPRTVASIFESALTATNEWIIEARQSDDQHALLTPSSEASLPSSFESDSKTSLDGFYFEYWRSTVVETLPPVFRDIVAKPPRFLPLRNAVLAVSCAHLAHFKSPAVGGYRSQQRMPLLTTNGPRHHGLSYYSDAVTLITQETSASSSSSQAQDILATLLLLHFFELELGSFSGVLVHMEGMDKLLPSIREPLISSPAGKRLLSTWLSCRSLVVNRRLALAISDRSRETPALWRLSTADIVDDCLGDLQSASDSMTVLLCKGLHLVRTIILDFAVCRNRAYKQGDRHPIFDPMLDHVSLPSSRAQSSPSELAVIDDAYQASLREQRIRLDHWHSGLDDFELPVESFLSQSGGDARDPAGGLVVHPLKFHTQRSAMNYAYYVAAQLLCSMEFWLRVTTNTSQSTSSGGGGPPSMSRWEMLILRIAAGISPSNCAHQSPLAISMTSLLTFCAGWCPDLRVADWVDKRVQEVEHHDLALDNNFPNTVVRRLLQEILDEKRQDRDFYLVSLLEPKDLDRDDIYSKGEHFWTAMCGKDRKTGHLWNRASVLSF